MPIIRLPSGAVKEIPDHGRHRVIEQHMKSDGTRRTIEHEFNLDTGIVRSDTYEEETGWMASSSDPLPERTHVGGGERPIEHYLHKGLDYANMASGGDGRRKPARKKTRKVSSWPSYLSAQDRWEQTVGGDMPHLTTGTRIRTPDPLGQDKYAYGTVIEMKDDAIPRGYELVCMDKPGPEYSDYPEVCGEMHGLILKQSNIRRAQFGSRESAVKGIPQHIGVFAPEGFEYQGKRFSRGAMGRVIDLRDGQTIAVKWANVRGVDEYYVPVDVVRWCYLDLEAKKVIRTWYTTHTPLNEGDILVYWGEKPNHLGGDYGRHSYAVTRGVLLRLDSWDESRCCINASIVAGMPAEILGARLQVRKQDVRKFEQPFIPQGREVEVVAEVVFRKKNLQGRKGKVILATDFEGDVGIEFPEDLGAGSLDGAGTDGHCLYIPVESVKEAK